MHVLVHAGMQKTGSSALQEYLHTNRQALQSCGVVYPDLDHRSHWRLAAAVVEETSASGYFTRRLDRGDAEQARLEALEVMRTAITSADDETLVIISHESFGRRAQCTGLIAFLAECGVPHENIRVLAYVRNPISHFPSGMQQYIKNKNPKTMLSPERWTSGHIRRAAILREHFGERLNLRAHGVQALVEGDIVMDFAAFVSAGYGKVLPTELARGVTLNTSLSAEACAILQCAKSVKGHEITDRNFVFLRNSVTKFDAGRGGQRISIPPEWIGWICKQNHEEWNRLVYSMDYDDDVKASLRIADMEPVGKVSRSDVKALIMGYYDPAYTRAFHDFLGGRARLEFGRAATVHGEMAAVMAAMEDFDPATQASDGTARQGRQDQSSEDEDDGDDEE